MKPLLGDRTGTDEARRVSELLEESGRWVASLGHREWTFDLVLVGDAVMQDLNGRFRGQDRVTDVLSFSDLSGGTAEEGRAPDLAAGEAGAWCDLWRDGPGFAEAPVGEVILAPDFIVARCRANGWPLETEIPMLVVHGCLHLLGWDHMEEEQARAMRRLETRCLAACGLAHPLAHPPATQEEGRS